MVVIGKVVPIAAGHDFFLNVRNRGGAAVRGRIGTAGCECPLPATTELTLPTQSRPLNLQESEVQRENLSLAPLICSFDLLRVS
jgi:hypothetical protein